MRAILLLMLSFLGCALRPSSQGSLVPSVSDIQLAEDLSLRPLGEGLWLHVSHQEIEPWGLVAANGLLVVDQGQAALVDTPWTDQQTETLIDYIEDTLGAKLILAIPTHHHNDNLGGLKAVHAHGASSIALDQTRELALAKGMEPPKQLFSSVETPMNHVGRIELNLRYPGAGHAVDNIVVWLPQRRVLFAGCLLKAADARSIGNTADADLGAWPVTAARILQLYPEASLIVPGHGEPGGFELVDRTLELLESQALPAGS